NGVAIHPLHPRAGDDLGDLVFDPLRPLAQLAQVGPAARGTGGRERLLLPARVAAEPVLLLVPGQSEAELAARHALAARGTENRGRPPPTVAKDQRLFAALHARHESF